MSTESAIVVAVVLAVLIIAAGFGLASGGIDIFKGVADDFQGNITTSQSSAKSPDQENTIREVKTECRKLIPQWSSGKVL